MSTTLVLLGLESGPKSKTAMKTYWRRKRFDRSQYNSVQCIPFGVDDELWECARIILPLFRSISTGCRNLKTANEQRASIGRFLTRRQQQLVKWQRPNGGIIGLPGCKRKLWSSSQKCRSQTHDCSIRRVSVYSIPSLSILQTWDYSTCSLGWLCDFLDGEILLVQEVNYGTCVNYHGFWIPSTIAIYIAPLFCIYQFSPSRHALREWRYISSFSLSLRYEQHKYFKFGSFLCATAKSDLAFQKLRWHAAAASDNANTYSNGVLI